MGYLAIFWTLSRIVERLIATCNWKKMLKS